MAEEIDQIKQADILELDSEWVLQKINVQGWGVLIDIYKISPRAGHKILRSAFAIRKR